MSTIAAGTTSTTALVSTGDTTGKLVLQTNGTTDAVTIDTSQRVGIGTSSPSSKLHVVGSQFRLQTDNCSHQFYNTAGSRYAYLEAASGGVVLDVESGGGSKFIVRSSGSEKIQVNQYGLCFNGDTAAANALDDYEEGTWTPTDVSGAGLSFSTAVGTYTKIGRMIYASTQIVYPSTANGSSALIGGLPFTLPATNVVRQGFISYANASVVARALPEDGQTRFDIRKTDGTNVTNSELSGKTLFAMLIYYV